MEPDLLSRYLCLFASDWLSPALFSRLLQQFKSLQSMVGADDDALMCQGLPPAQIELLRHTAPALHSKFIDQHLEWAVSGARNIVCYEDPRYPELLRQIDTPPALLFVHGNSELLAHKQLAVVGSRKASSYGLRNAYWMAHELSEAGLVISSGMARGIDTRAHQGALASSGITIAVTGTGADSVYPAANEKLAAEIAEKGALISEFPLGTLPLPSNFPRRNRIMSGLSLGTLVIEAAIKSGSLITARYALEQNRDVFAIPGLISNASAAGCHKLIADGARLVEKPADILQELGIEVIDESLVNTIIEGTPKSTVHKRTRHASKANSLIHLIGEQGCELQSLLEATGDNFQTLMQQLLELELAGEITVQGGRYFRAEADPTRATTFCTSPGRPLA